jgi:hypothetical protein
MSAASRAALSAFELRREGWIALTERLGVSGAIRFMMQYDAGHGDYTVERSHLLEGLSLEQAISQIKARHTPGEPE